MFAGVRKNEDGVSLLREPRAGMKGSIIPVLLDVTDDKSVQNAIKTVSVYITIKKTRILTHREHKILEQRKTTISECACLHAFAALTFK